MRTTCMASAPPSTSTSWPPTRRRWHSTTRGLRCLQPASFEARGISPRPLSSRSQSPFPTQPKLSARRNTGALLSGRRAARGRRAVHEVRATKKKAPPVPPFQSNPQAHPSPLPNDGALSRRLNTDASHHCFLIMPPDIPVSRCLHAQKTATHYRLLLHASHGRHKVAH